MEVRNSIIIDGIIYIRKDALLEWIHTELDAIEGKEEMSQMELAFTEVIDKIQRM